MVFKYFLTQFIYGNTRRRKITKRKANKRLLQSQTVRRKKKAGEVVVAQEATDAGTTGTEEVVAGEAVAQEIASAVAVATGEAVAAVAEEVAAQETADADKGEQAPPQMQALQLRRSRNRSATHIILRFWRSANCFVLQL